jgi:hypothetical protein
VKNQGLQAGNLRLQLRLERYKKCYYGQRADRLRSGELVQMLLEFAKALERKPVNPHLRRKILEAKKVAPEIARQTITRIGALYAFEKQASGVSAESPILAPAALRAGAGPTA